MTDNHDTPVEQPGLLAQAGYQTILCADAKETYAKIPTRQPDLAILNLQMGCDGEAGWEIRSLVRLDIRTGHLPLIMCSGDAELLQARRELRRAKGCDILAKPSDVDKLLARIAKMSGPPPAMQAEVDRSGLPRDSML